MNPLLLLVGILLAGPASWTPEVPGSEAPDLVYAKAQEKDGIYALLRRYQACERLRRPPASSLR
jgi:hypothetical protein